MAGVVGIDPSLTSTGLAIRANSDKLLSYALGDASLRGVARLMFFRNAIERHIKRVSPDLVAYEGYALGFRGKSNTLFDLGELGGVLKLLILEMGVDILLVPPNNLKLFTTGKGNADKSQVSVAVGEALDVKFSTSDQYDAAGLLWMGETYRKFSGKPNGLPDHQAKALKGCTLLKGF